MTDDHNRTAKTQKTLRVLAICKGTYGKGSLVSAQVERLSAAHTAFNNNLDTSHTGHW